MVELTWRVTNDDGLSWPWPTREQAEAQVVLWESQGDRGFITPVFRRDGIELTDDGLAEWIAAANQALSLQDGRHG